MKCPKCGRKNSVKELYNVWYCMFCKEVFDGKNEEVPSDEAYLNYVCSAGEIMPKGQAIKRYGPVRHPTFINGHWV